MSELKSRYDVGWFSAYDTLKGMVVLYGFSKVLEALMEIGEITLYTPDGVACPHNHVKSVNDQLFCLACGEDVTPHD